LLVESLWRCGALTVVLTDASFSVDT